MTDKFLPAIVPSRDLPLVPANQQIAILQANFAAFVDARQFEQATIDTYKAGLKRFCDWFLSVKAMPGDIGIAFRNYLVSYGLKPKSVNTILAGLRSYCGFLVARKLLQINPFIGPKVKVGQRKMMQVLSLVELKRMLKGIQQIEPQRLVEYRDYAIIYLMATTGLRVSSVITANIKDRKDLQGQRILQIRHKGRVGKDDFVILDQVVDDAISAYLVVSNHSSGALFRPHPGRNSVKPGKRLDRHSLGAAVKGRFRAAGLNRKGLSAHTLRRTAITLARKMGSELEDLRAMAGHSSIKTTEGYDQAQRRLENAPELILGKAIRGEEK